MMEPAFRLGLDLGTSSLKAVVIDSSGAVVASNQASYPTRAGADGRGAEQEPADWIAAAGRAVADLHSELGAEGMGRIRGIGLAGQLPTLVVLDETGPLSPAIAWLDDRADAMALPIVERFGSEALYRRTGMRIDGRYLAPMFRYHFGGRPVRPQAILSAKDFLCFALTGRLVTDPSTAAGYALFALDEGRWDDALLELWGISRGLLPAIAPADALAGGLHAEGARLLGLRPGLPVSVGAADSVASALAMGGLQAGTAVIIMGSSTVILDSVARPIHDPLGRYILTPHAVDGWYGREMDLLATGTGFDWLSRLFNLAPDQRASEVLKAPVGSNGVSFAPYLSGGEQGALWDPSLSGAIHGLALRHQPSDILRAFLEGAMFEIRRCLGVLGEAGPLGRVVIAGRLAESEGLLQMLADALHLPVTPYFHSSPAAIGAAMNAPVAATSASSAGHEGTVMPTDAASTYDALYRAYLDRFPTGAR